MNEYDYKVVEFQPWYIIECFFNLGDNKGYNYESP
jgi:hypothetical protein